MNSFRIHRSSRQNTFGRSTSWSRAGRTASVAAALITGLAPLTSQAQSMQSVSDRLTQLQSSLNAFATSTAASFNAVIAKLDTIIARVSESATPPRLATGLALIPDASYAPACTVTNVGASAAAVFVQMIDSAGNILGTQLATLSPSQGDGFSLSVLGKAEVWCQFVSTTAGAQLRASLAVYRVSDLVTIVRAEAR